MRKTMITIMLFSALCSICVAQLFGQSCGVPPGPFSYSHNFYRAEAKYYDSSSNTSVGATIPVDGLPIKGSLDSGQSVTDWQTLTIQEAQSYVQQEHASKKAQILAECGYRLCELANSPGSVSKEAVAVYAEVCSQSLLPSDSAANKILTVRPGAETAIFLSNATQTRSVTVTNNSPGSLKVRLSIEPGATGEKVLSVNVPTEFTILPKASRSIAVSIKKPTANQALSQQLVFEAVNDTTVNARVQFATYSDPALLLPPPSIEPGTIWPNAHIRLDIDNPTSPFIADHFGPYNLPVQQGPQMCNPGGFNTCGKSIYSATLSSPPSTADHTSAQLSITSYLGGTCGSGNTGGEGGIQPRWEAPVSLPGLANRQMWKIDLKTDIRYMYNWGGGPGQCAVSIGPITNMVEKEGQSAGLFSLAPGSYVLQLSCSATSPDLGCYGHANKVDEAYYNGHFNLTIDAKRVGSSPAGGMDEYLKHQIMTRSNELLK